MSKYEVTLVLDDETAPVLVVKDKYEGEVIRIEVTSYWDELTSSAPKRHWRQFDWSSLKELLQWVASQM